MEVCEEKLEIKIDGEKYTLADPIVDGRDVLEIAEKRPLANFMVFQFLKNGQFEEIRQDEKVDLRDQGVETFLTFEGDRCFRLKIEDQVFTWGSNTITGRWLYKLGGIDSKTSDLYLISVGGEDKQIRPKDIVDLCDREVECFMARKKFSICIEGKTYPWPKSTITTEEIAVLGGWELSQGVVAIDKDQNERTLQPGEVVSLKEGLSFCKKQRFKRGLNEECRIAEELTLLEQNYRSVSYKTENGLYWFLVSGLALPPPLSPGLIDVVFSITLGHPISKPYGFYIPEGIESSGTKINFEKPPNAPPFEGSWCFKSWDAPHWSPKADVLQGDNLWGWVRSFREAILEGP